MLADDCRFEGFDTRSWTHLLALFQAQGDARSAETALAMPRRGHLVVVVDAHDVPCAAFVTGRGPISGEELGDDVHALEALCERFAVEGAVVLRDGAIEELTERAAQRVSLQADYFTQWLGLLDAARELEREGAIKLWPSRVRTALPTPAVLRHVIDLVLPDERVLAVALWDDQELWTAIAIQRSGGAISRIVGSELLAEWAGPLGGDYRRDYRVLQQAIAHAIGPLHCGVFAQRRRVQALLRDPEPGAWARAVALREVIVSPAPPFVHVAMGADAVRAAGFHARLLLDQIDLRGQAERLRTSAQTVMAANPLHTLTERLRRAKKPNSEA